MVKMTVICPDARHPQRGIDKIPGGVENISGGAMIKNDTMLTLKYLAMTSQVFK